MYRACHSGRPASLSWAAAKMAALHACLVFGAIAVWSRWLTPRAFQFGCRSIRRSLISSPFCVGSRRPVLNNPEIFVAILKICDLREQWETVAAVVMPDHLHALVRPVANRDAKITQYSAGLKRFVRRETKAAWKWQDGVFDRLLRRDESAESKWIYMRENPVRAGLVRRWEDWPYAIGYHV